MLLISTSTEQYPFLLNKKRKINYLLLLDREVALKVLLIYFKFLQSFRIWITIDKDPNS